MKFRRMLSALLCLSIILPCFVITPYAAEENDAASAETTTLSTEIMGAKGGAKAIVSMTYDDGQYETAAWMNEMFAKYGLRASCMLIVSRHQSESVREKWQAIFDEGYLSPENHSMTHKVLPGTEWSNYEANKQNNTPENYQYELVDSKALLEELFGQKNITFAASNNTLYTDAAAIVMDTYYVMRKGTRGKVQSFEPIEGSDAPGGWYNPYMRGIDNSTLEENKSWVQMCIDQGGWFISMTHSVINDSDDPTKPERYEAFYQYLAEKQSKNEIWVTTFADATRYLRERQNSEAYAYSNADGVFVRVDMADTTGDGLPLDEEIFNLPLTVKVEVPKDWSVVAYELSGESVYTNAFAEDGKNYVYVDVLPNGGEVSLSSVEFYEANESAAMFGYITSGGGFTAGEMISTAHTERFRAEENYKVYAKLPISAFSDSTNAVLPITVDSEVTAKLNIYGVSDPALCASWSSLSLNPYNAPANDIFGVVTDEAELVCELEIVGADTYLADITPYIEEMKLAGSEWATVVIAVAEDSSAESVEFKFGTESDVPSGSGTGDDFVPYTFAQNFENATGKGGFATGGVGSNEGNSFTLGEAEGYLGESTKCIVWKSTRTYERAFLGGVLNAENTLTDSDIGSIYRVTFRFKAEGAGTFVVWLGNSATKATYSSYPSEKLCTFKVEDEDVGKWIKYTCVFTIDESNITPDATKGAQDVCFAIAPKSFTQSVEAPVMLYLDDIVSTKVNNSAKSAMIPTEYKTLYTTDDILRVGVAKNDRENVRISYLSFDKKDISDSLSSELNLNVIAASGQIIQIYALLGATLGEDVTFENAPGLKDGEVDRSAVFGGVPIYEGASECGKITLDVHSYISSQDTSAVFMIVTDDVSERELLYLDFESLPVTEGVDYTADGVVTLDEGRAVVDGASISFDKAFRAAVFGETYTVSAVVPSGVTLTVGDESVTSSVDGKISLTVIFDEDVKSVVFTSDAPFSVDDLTVELSNSPVVIGSDSSMLLLKLTDYDFSVITPHVSMRLSDTFTLCFYINKLDAISEAVAGDKQYTKDTIATAETAFIGEDEYYVFAVPFDTTLSEIAVSVTVGVMNDDGHVIYKSYSYVPFEYIETVLEDPSYADARDLILCILSYIRACKRREDTNADTANINKILFNYTYFEGSDITDEVRTFAPDAELIEKVEVDVSHGWQIIFTPTEEYRQAGAELIFKHGGILLDAVRLDDGRYVLSLPMHLAASRVTVTLVDESGEEAVTDYNLNYSINNSDAYLSAALARLAACAKNATNYRKA